MGKFGLTEEQTRAVREALYYEGATVRGYCKTRGILDAVLPAPLPAALGTLTQEQVDAVKTATREAVAEQGWHVNDANRILNRLFPAPAAS